MKYTLTATIALLGALCATGTSAGASHSPGYWNKNVCKPLYLVATADSPARASEHCARNVTLHVYVNGHAQILIATMFHNTAEFYGNSCVVRIRSAHGNRSVLAETTSYRPARIRVRFTPDWQLG
jgi:hypothetical protein